MSQSDNPYAVTSTTSEASNQYLAFGYPYRGMRFWRVGQLKAEMEVQPLSDREVLPYIVLYVAMTNLVMGLPQSDLNALDAFDTLCCVLIAIVGTIYIFRCNGGVDGQYFLQRYFAIGFVVAVRCIVALIALFVPLAFTLDALGLMTEETSWYDVLISVVIQVLVYWRTGKHIGDLARSTPQPAAQ